MDDKQVELISALLDGEVDRDTTHRLVDRLTAAADADDLARFGRYRLIGDVIRGESAVIADSVATRVRQSLQDEPTILAPQRSMPAWLKPAAGLAIAASVAAAAVVVAPQLLQGPGSAPGTVQIAASDAARALPAPALVAARTTGPDVSAAAQPAANPKRWQALDEELADRLNRLVIEHHEFGGRTGINGPVAHIGLVSYDRR